MKVFGIGLNKTGTTTLGECFKTLGFRHAPYERRLLYKIKEGKFQRVWRIATEYESFEDWPWPLIYEKLDRRFPEARFVLTTRESAARWLDSLKRHAERTGTPRVRELVYGYPMPHGHEAEHVAFYERHNRAVTEYFADRPGKLLTVCWETAGSWDDLCGFLDRPIPDRPFPHANPRPRA